MVEVEVELVEIEMVLLVDQVMVVKVEDLVGQVELNKVVDMVVMEEMVIEAV